MNPTLAHWNALAPEQAAQGILPCCGSGAWADRLAACRPILSFDALCAASDRIWHGLPRQDQLQALATHPRIGERHALATARSLSWSSGEQSAAAADPALNTELAEANRLYEARFQRTFIVCATDKSAPQILAILNHRLANTPEQEFAEATEQQRRITRIRLAKWLEQA